MIMDMKNAKFMAEPVLNMITQCGSCMTQNFKVPKPSNSLARKEVYNPSFHKSYIPVNHHYQEHATMPPVSSLSSSQGVQMRGTAIRKGLGIQRQRRCQPIPKSPTAYLQGESVGIRPPIVKVRVK